MECVRWNFVCDGDSLLVCKGDHEKGQVCSMEQMPTKDILELVESLRQRVLDVRRFVADDSVAATYQTLGQYRDAVIKCLDA